jgi:hypothetical protein
MKLTAFWATALCSIVEVYRRFRDACCLHQQSPNEVVIRNGETPIYFIETTQRYIPEDYIFIVFFATNFLTVKIYLYYFICYYSGSLVFCSNILSSARLLTGMWLVPPFIQPVYSLEIEKMEADDPLLLQENEAEV